MISPAGEYEISGTASLGRVLDFKLTRGAEMKPAYRITGTVAEPRVTATPETQARLKP